MGKEKLTRRVLACEWIGFGLVLIFLWLNELLDLPHRVFGTPPTPVNWSESVVESVLVVALAVLSAFATRLFLARIRYLEGYLQVCSSCKRVHVGDEWVPFDVFLRDHSDAAISHGLCPECAMAYRKTIGTRNS